MAGECSSGGDPWLVEGLRGRLNRQGVCDRQKGVVGVESWSDKRWRPGRATRAVGWLVLVAVLLSLLVLFIADNFVVVEIRVFTVHRPVRLAWALLLAFASGVALGALAMRLWRR